VALIIISSEMPEVIALSDRIVVFCEGRISGSLEARDATEQNLMQLMAISTAATQAREAAV
jgi:ABC-type sugar transport system ATPase subunit